MELHLGPSLHQATMASRTLRGAPTRRQTHPLYKHAIVDEQSIDHSGSWVMLKQDGNIEPLEGESIVLQTPSHVSLELGVPKSLRTPQNATFAIKCDDGVAYVTNRRIIYLAAKPTATFQSFSAFILDTYDAHPLAGGWLGFGAWRWKAEAKPRPGGGVPADVPRVELTLILNNGGIDGFHSKYSLMYERLSHARDIRHETGARVTVHDDDLPPYSAAGEGAPLVDLGGGSTAVQQPVPLQESEAPAVPPADESRGGQSAPVEPPPGYDDSQFQAVEQRFEEREREDAERAH